MFVFQVKKMLMVHSFCHKGKSFFIPILETPQPTLVSLESIQLLKKTFMTCCLPSPKCVNCIKEAVKANDVPVDKLEMPRVSRAYKAINPAQLPI